jgi:hypothetical protein
MEITLMRHREPAYELKGRVRANDISSVIENYDFSGIKEEARTRKRGNDMRKRGRKRGHPSREGGSEDGGSEDTHHIFIQ